MKVLADLDVCIGSGTCVTIAPAVFDQNTEDGRVKLLVDEVPDQSEDIALIREAVELCPSAALSIREEEEA